MRFSEGGLTLRDLNEMPLIELSLWIKAAGRINKEEEREIRSAQRNGR